MGLHLSEGLAENRGSASKMAHLHSYWQEASAISLAKNLSFLPRRPYTPVERPHDVAVGFSQSDLRDRVGGSCDIFYGLVTYSHFCHSLLS